MPRLQSWGYHQKFLSKWLTQKNAAHHSQPSSVDSYSRVKLVVYSPPFPLDQLLEFTIIRSFAVPNKPELAWLSAHSLSIRWLINQVSGPVRQVIPRGFLEYAAGCGIGKVWVLRASGWVQKNQAHSEWNGLPYFIPTLFCFLSNYSFHPPG